MSTVDYHTFNSTIGRTHRRLGRTLKLQPRKAAACHSHCHRMLTAVCNWYHDPLGIAADLEGLTLDEQEILSDLDHGRD